MKAKKNSCRLNITSSTFILKVGIVISLNYFFLLSHLYSQTIREDFSTLVYDFSTTGATTWTAPPGNYTTITVECFGGGGSGGSRDAISGGGGGGGGYSRSTITITPGNTYNLYVGNGGVRVNGGSSNIDGNNGEHSWFNTSTTIRANGGTKGNGAANGDGGAGATVGVGDVTYTGGTGGTTQACGADISGGGGSSGYYTGNGSNSFCNGSVNSEGGKIPDGYWGGDGGEGDPDMGANGEDGRQPGGGGGGGGEPHTQCSLPGTGAACSGKGGDGWVRITMVEYNTHIISGGSPGGSLCDSATKQPIYSFLLKLDNGSGTSNFTDLSFTTTGTYAAADITKFQLWYNTIPDLATASQISSDLSPAVAGNQAFASFSQALTKDNLSYFWITTDVPTTSTNGATIAVSALTISQITMADGSKIAETSNGGIYTINTSTSLTSDVHGGGENYILDTDVLTLNGATFGGSATQAGWSIIKKYPTTLGDGTLSSTANTASPETITYTPADGNFYEGLILLRLTSNNTCVSYSERVVQLVNKAATFSNKGRYQYNAPEYSCGFTVDAEVWGGGGGGGGGDPSNDAMGGGGGGGYAKRTSIALTAGATYNLKVGAGGRGGTGWETVQHNGLVGEDSWFNATTGASAARATGGAAGTGKNGGTAAGGVGTVGTTTVSGGVGGNAPLNAPSEGAGGGEAGGSSGTGGAGVVRTGGNGVNADGGDGGNGGLDTGSGSNGSSPGGGGGGSGGDADETGYGGSGADGQVKLTVTLSSSGSAIANNTITSSAETVCAGTAASVISCNTPTGGGGAYTYLWQTSTTSSTTGFSTATGVHGSASYTPSAISKTTWFRRIVYSQACAATYTNTSTAIKVTTKGNIREWDGGGGDDNLQTAANWVDNIAPVEKDILAFDGAIRTTPYNDFAAGTEFSSIKFNNGSSSFTLSGNALTLSSVCASAITASNTSNTMIIQNNLTMSATSSITSTSGGTLNITGTINNGGYTIINNCGGTETFSGDISGAGAFTKIGSGTLTLSGANTFSGGLNLNAGTININNATALGATAGTFSISAGTTINNNSGGAITNSNNNPQTWAGDFTFTGSNDLNLGTGTVTMSASRQITASANKLIIGGVIGGSSMNLTKAGNGTLVLSGANTYDGTTTISAGTLQLGNSGVIADASAVTVNSPGILDMNGYNETIGSLAGSGTLENVSAGGTTVLTAGGNNTSTTFSGIAQNTSGTVNITKTGSVALTLSGANTHTGGVTLSAGTLNINNATALGGTTGVFTIANGTTINNSTGGAITNSNNNPLTLNGDFTFTGTQNLNLGTGDITMGGNIQITTSANTLTMGGTNSNATRNLTKAGAGILAFGSNAVTINNLTISAGTLNSTSGNLSLAGNFANSSTFNHNNGTVIFNGTTDQTIGTTGVQAFYNLTVNNTGADGSNDVTLNEDATVANSLTLTDGILNTTSSNILTITNTSTSASNGGAAGSFVSGPMTWSVTTGGPYIFPTGKASTKWARVGLVDVSANSVFTCEYFNAGYSSSTLDANDAIPLLTDVSDVEYWDVTRNSGGNAKVRLYFENNTTSKINDCDPNDDLVVAHYTSTEWRNANTSGVIPVSSSGACSGVVSGHVTSDLLTSFSPFTFGSKTGGAVNPLPIELMSFTTFYNGKSVDVKWVTATEINNDYFTIERSLDGINYEIVAIISSKAISGNSTSSLSYYYEDLNSKPGIYYYRLKQTDYDGKYSYSPVSKVIITCNNEFTFNVFPNPNDGKQISAMIVSDANQEVKVRVYDMLGQFVFEQTFITVEDGVNTFVFNFLGGRLSDGVYVFSATTKTMAPVSINVIVHQM
jgi:fibronectin-binding autotransporter adhesin